MLSSVYFKNLDSIRFIAALMVLLGHSVKPIYNNLDLGNGVFYHLLQTVCNGELGVSVFFVLSGFLITYLLLKEQQIYGKISLKNFYIRRILRIWPLYFVVVLFTFGIYPLIKTILYINNPLASQFLMHLVFLSNFDVIRVQTFFTGLDALSQNVTWSVSIEEQFYLFWPLLFVFFSRRAWPYFIVVVILLSLFYRGMHHGEVIVLYYHTISVLVDLAVGGMAAFLAIYSGSFRNYFEKSGTIKLAAFMLLAFVSVFLSPWLFTLPYGAVFSRLFIVCSFVFFITSQALTSKNSPLQLNRWRFANKWGKYTYGIYLIHPIVITISAAVIRTFGEFSEITLTIVVALITFPLTLVLSYFSYRYYESRFLALKPRFEAVQTTG